MGRGASVVDLATARAGGSLRRVAVLSLHTSPLEQPGTGDAGGMNVYVVETARRIAATGVEVEVFTRATSSDLPSTVELAPGVLVRHVTAGPFEGLSKHDLASQLCAFTSAVLRVEAQHEPGYFDVVHSHYWLSGQVGWLVAERWGVPLVHSAHTLAKVKNSALADGDEPEPLSRVVGEEQVVAAADRLVAATGAEARQLVELYDADPDRVVTIAPGVDLEQFRPGEASAARTRLGIPPDAVVPLFVGRLQPLKAPDVLLRAVAELVAQRPELRGHVVVPVVGGPSGTGAASDRQQETELDRLERLAADLGIRELVRFEPPAAPERLVDFYRAATAVVVPSYNETFGLVALEAQACGTPVIAAAVGGLTTAVRDGASGLLVDGHDPREYAEALRRVVDEPRLRDRLGAGGVQHAAQFDWSVTTTRLLETYAEAVEHARAALVAAAR